jgi:hypothetical protein
MKYFSDEEKQGLKWFPRDPYENTDNAESPTDFASMGTDEISLKEAENSAREFALKRKRQLGFRESAEPIAVEDDDGSADIQHLNGRVRSWLRRTNRLKFYGKNSRKK